MSGRSRIERFVGSARALLAAQVAAAAGATALTVWAAVEVQSVIDENERLAARVAELERGRRPAPEPIVGEVPRSVDPSTAAAAAQSPPAQPDGRGVEDEGGGEVNRIEDPPPPDQSCRALDGREIDCVPPYRRLPERDVCLDGNERRIRCPPGVEETADPTPAPPPRDCRNALGRPIECVPPFRATPRAGLCLDGRMRLVRCPPGEPIRGEQQESARPPVG